MDELLEGDFEVVDECTEEDEANMESSLHTRNAFTDDNDGIQIIDECIGDDEVMVLDQNSENPDLDKSNRQDQDNTNQSTKDSEIDADNDNTESLTAATTDTEICEAIDQSTTSSNQADNDVIFNELDGKIEEVDKTSTHDEKYEKKFKGKVKIVEERFSKLARVLECSYPVYHNWLHKVQLTSGTSVCKMEKPRRCPVNQPYINRWKFICNKTSVPEETIEDDGTVSKTTRIVWQMAISDSNSECPDFVMRAVKVFENFIQATNQIPEEIIIEDENGSEGDKPKHEKVKKPDWLCLLVRSNRKGELMLFASGKNVNSAIMDSLKELYTIGGGKDCNVKSLYCKTFSRSNNQTQTNTTFLAGSETLDEEVNGVKVQLAPKTNFPLNTDGVEVLATTIKDLLNPTPKTSVVEIGCGIGVLGLTLASKCNKVIGYDTASEIEEAEMMCEINGIKNASFVTGNPAAVLATIAKYVTATKATAIVNANTNIARTLEVMTGLRRINSIRRLVMVTTLTKQSVRSILELSRPPKRPPPQAHLGNPFIPVRAYVVDTLPYGPDYEIAILMERRMMQTIIAPIPPQLLEKEKSDKVDKPKLADKPKQADKPKPVEKPKPIDKPKPAEKPKQSGTNSATTAPATVTISSPVPTTKDGPSKDKISSMPTKIDKPAAASTPAKTLKSAVLNKSFPSSKNQPYQNKFVSKKSFTPTFNRRRTFQPYEKDQSYAPHSQPFKKTFNDFNSYKNKRPYDKFHNTADKVAPKKFKPWQSDNRFDYNSRDKHQNSSFREKDRSSPVRRKREWQNDSSVVVNPMHEKKMREDSVRSPNQDLRQQLSGRRENTDIVQKVKEQAHMVEMAKEKFTHGSSNIDVNTAKQLQSMLSMVLEETNKLQSQLPHSVWDRIAPAPQNKTVEHEGPSNMKNRFVQESSDEIRIITTNNQYGSADKSNNARGRNRQSGSNYDRPMHNLQTGYRKPDMPIEQSIPRPVSPPRHRIPSPLGSRRSPPRPVPPPRGMSPMRKTSPYRGRPISPSFRSHASPPVGHQQGAIDCARPRITSATSPGRSMRRSYNSPPRRNDERFTRDHHPQTQSRFSLDDRQSMQMTRINSPVKQQQHQHQQQQQQQRRANSPARFIDEWDIPTRGAVEQNLRPADNSLARPMDTRERWSNASRELNKSWQQQKQQQQQKPSVDDRFGMKHPPSKDEGNWEIMSRSQNLTGTSNQNLMGTQSLMGTPWRNNGLAEKRSRVNIGDDLKKTFSANMDAPRNLNNTRWSNSDLSLATSSFKIGDNWNQREKESFSDMRRPDFREKSRWDPQPTGGQNSRFQPMDKDDCDLPEDARDPWGDDNNGDGPKERWQSSNISFGSNFQREKEPMEETWKNDSGNNWQNRSANLNKSPWQAISNMVVESRWQKPPPSDVPRFQPMATQQQVSNTNSMFNWQQQPPPQPLQNFSSFSQQQRNFPMNTMNIPSRR